MKLSLQENDIIVQIMHKSLDQFLFHFTFYLNILIITIMNFVNYIN